MSRAWTVRRAALVALVAAAASPAACSRDVLIGENRAPAGSAAPGGAPGAGGKPPGDGSACHEIRCQTHLYECGNCKDDDGDGLVDLDDPDCLGPCQNSEKMFF